jgi:hypothetical protein
MVILDGGTRLLCAIVVQFYEGQDALRVDQVGAGLLVWVFPRNGAQKSACDLGAEKKICSFSLLSSVLATALGHCQDTVWK